MKEMVTCSLYLTEISLSDLMCVCVCVCSVCNDIKCQELESLCMLQHWNEPSNIGS